MHQEFPSRYRPLSANKFLFDPWIERGFLAPKPDDNRETRILFFITARDPWDDNSSSRPASEGLLFIRAEFIPYS